jgi:hypothetical protein
MLCMSWHQLSAQSNTPCTTSTPSAPFLTVGASCSYTAGTTAGATAQTNAANGGTPSCGSMGPDVWYRIIAPASGSINIATSAGSITDGVMALYSGTCGAFTQIACNDDAVGLMPAISASGLTPGATYYIRFWKYGGGTGTFNICVTTGSAAPTNTSCSTQTPICSGTPINFTANTGGSPASTVNPGNNYGCLATSPNPSWYYLKIASAGQLIVDISAGSDVDFALWGPYTSLTTAQSACNSYPTPTACSYSISATEQVNVPSVSAGQVYVLLVTNYANTVQNITVNNAGGSATTDCSIVTLPVGFSFWDLSVINGDVALSWKTETEEQNSHFLVQRSADGTIWETIGLVEGNGTTTAPHSYSYRDESPIVGVGYYRLQQVDLDGNSKFTDVLSANTLDENSLKVFPNPSKGEFTIVIPSEDVSDIVLTDVLGKMHRPRYSDSGTSVLVNTEEMSKGIYTLTVISAGEKIVRRIAID